MKRIKYITEQSQVLVMVKQELIQIPRKEYEELLEEVGIIRNKEMMEAIRESSEAKKKGVKSWGLNI